MDARYFRMMYQNVKEGMVHTISVDDSEKNCKWTAYYLCGNNNSETLSKTDERFTVCEDGIQLMVMANLKTVSIEKAVEIIRANTVEQIVLPICEQQTIDTLKAAGVAEVHIMQDGEVMELGCGIWQTTLRCYGQGQAASIVMYHSSDEIKPNEQDCVLTINSFSKQQPYTVCVNNKDLSCDMKNSLYNDFDVCKGHNAKTRDYYITGTLLLGNVDLQKYCDLLERNFEGKRETIRFISIPGTCALEDWKGIMNWIDAGSTGDKKYFVGLAGKQGDETVLKNILEAGPRHVPMLPNEEFGICASGFFTKRG